MRSQQIFVIDDDDDLRFTIALSLREAGLAVEEFASADAALPEVRARPPGAIMLDYRIEGMRAEDFVAHVRAQGADAPPIVLLSGTHDLGALAARLGVFDSLGKPFDLDDLIGRARRALAHGR